MKSAKVQTLGAIWLNYIIGIFGIETPLHAYYVLGEHTSMKNELYILDFKSQGLSIEPRSSIICIDLSMHVHL